MREFEALEWLARHGLPAPTPLVALVCRQLGFVRRTTLVTTEFPGQPADTLLPTLRAEDRMAVAKAIGELVGRLHHLGFRDRNLDLRNMLVQPTDEGWLVGKIDSPRWRLSRPGARIDAATRADWQRLGPQLAAFGLLEAARASADAARQ